MSSSVENDQVLDTKESHVPMSKISKDKRSPMKSKRFIIVDPIDAMDFSLLPENWIQLRHVSGLNLYLHRPSRVVTLSRPYCIGPGSARYHRIPVTAIPCLAHRRVHDIKTECPESAGSQNPKSSCEQIRQESLTSMESMDDSNTHPNRCASPPTQPSEAICSTNPSVQSSKEDGELSSGDEGTGTRNSDRPTKQLRLDPEPDESHTNSSMIVAAPASPAFQPKSASGLGAKRRRYKRGFPFGKRSETGDCTSVASGSTDNPSEPNLSGTGIQELENVKTQVFSVKDKENESLLTPEEVRNYCSRLFEIKVEDCVLHRNPEFKTQRQPADDVANTNEDDTQKPLLMMPEEAKVIRYQIPSVDGNGTRKQPKEGFINMTGKSYVCILHEYCQNVIRRPPTYQTTVLENDRNPYQMTVIINGNPCATGVGLSKKHARLEAARKALEILIPDFQKIVGSTPQQTGPAVVSDRDVQLFDSIPITDPRLYELSVRMALPTPYNLLIECLSRSCVPETDLKSSMTSQGRSKHFFTLQLREHVVKLRCKNKREGRHLAAQNLLALLHPEITMWGGLLRMYGPGSKPDKRSELDTIQDAQTQQKSAVKASLIKLLKAKMSELADQWEKSGGSTHLKGKFLVPPYNLPVVTFHPDSNTDLYSSNALNNSAPSSPSPN